LGTFEQNIEKNGSEKKELLERKIGGKKSKIGAALAGRDGKPSVALLLPVKGQILGNDIKHYTSK